MIAFPRDEDVPAPRILAHRIKMLPSKVTVGAVDIQYCIAQIGHQVWSATDGRRSHLDPHDFAQPVTVEEMAASVHMSASSFHQSFKAVTTLSLLQYQKGARTEGGTCVLRDRRLVDQRDGLIA